MADPKGMTMIGQPTHFRARHFPVVLLCLVAALLPGACQERPVPERVIERDGRRFFSMVLAGRPYELELATTAQQRFQGLSDRESIPEDGGMLFVFADARERAFLMRRCKVPIAILYLNHDGRIVSMYEMQVEPEDTPEADLKRYPSIWPAQFVIELKGGSIEKLELTKGMKIEEDWRAVGELASQ